LPLFSSIVLIAVVGPISIALLLLLLTAVAWRGCPTCWTVGLLATLADGRARRDRSRCWTVGGSATAVAPKRSSVAGPPGDEREGSSGDAVGDACLGRSMRPLW